MKYGRYMKLLTKVTLSTSLVLGLLLAITIFFNGGVAGEINLDLALSTSDSIWLLLGAPALITTVFALLSPLSFLIFSLISRIKPPL